MHIAVVTTGSRGDTEPYVALGAALADAGYTVTVGAPPNFEGMVRSRGLHYAPIAGDFNRLLSAEGERGGFTGGTLKTGLAVRRMVGPIIQQIGDDVLAASQRADAIVSALPLAADDVAAHLQVPYIAASLFPFARTSAHAHPFFPPRTPRVFNRATYFAAEQLAWRMFATALNRWRAERFGMDRIGPLGPFRAQAEMTRLTLHGYSPRVVPPPPDSPKLRVTGYWFTPPDARWQPPADLVKFLAAGPPPVFVGFGSMPDPDPAATTAQVLDAVQQAGQRAVLHRGWAQLGAADLPDNVLLIGETPYGWLFPRMAAVVHHGGAGTTGHVFRAGVPQVVVPHAAEQPFWAHRVKLAGVGASVPRKRLTADRLAAALRQVTGDPAISSRAAALGDAIRTEDGLGAAVEVIRAALG